MLPVAPATVGLLGGGSRGGAGWGSLTLGDGDNVGHVDDLVVGDDDLTTSIEDGAGQGNGSEGRGEQDGGTHLGLSFLFFDTGSKDCRGYQILVKDSA